MASGYKWRENGIKQEVEDKLSGTWNKKFLAYLRIGKT